ncbi:NUDIX hydrolase [Natranaerobius trueperi]|uniref:NUDIX hydrolase n=1 Tax=Natranaerobius trueperi TaxID=759412 RepID=UPI00197B8049|nr:CoA pyrophosphatase [Natranaerobius trueperi]
MLLPIIIVENSLHILFQVRSKKMNTQPGEISFPGGRIEKTETPKEASVRETKEELGVIENDIEVFGELDYLLTPFNMIIIPYIGFLDTDINNMKVNKTEVEEVFSIPINYFINNKPQCYNTKVEPIPEENFPYHLIPNESEYKFRNGTYPSYFYLYQDKVIWGFTARILKNFIELYSQNN